MSRIVVSPSVNAKPFTWPDSQEVQHCGGQEADSVAGHDRLARSGPATRHRRPERTSLPDLVLDAFEEHHERVRRHTDTDDQTRDTGQVQGVVDVSAQQHQDREDHRARGDQGQRDEQAEHPVVEQRVQQHRRQPDRARDQPGPQRRQAQGRRDRLRLRGLERQRQRAVLQHVGQFTRRVGGEMSGDLGASAGNGLLDLTAR